MDKQELYKKSFLLILVIVSSCSFFKENSYHKEKSLTIVNKYRIVDENLTYSISIYRQKSKYCISLKLKNKSDKKLYIMNRLENHEGATYSNDGRDTTRHITIKSGGYSGFHPQKINLVELLPKSTIILRTEIKDLYSKVNFDINYIKGEKSIEKFHLFFQKKDFLRGEAFDSIFIDYGYQLVIDDVEILNKNKPNYLLIKPFDNANIGD
jgi:hypothetical protein